ncbi:biotin--[acetyl-CoA-carboxylase] ligase [Novosphingobium sp.]|uniref:biotin--[acetyl-CoA-carboxylase] ligase n=1 Tax=Novosphingobium sp. TaxID=1874826 RepID=UPI0025D42516|nr:biotin--[acetyl-CoA-carboxylase] ligase [Novosphingobium sp.]MCC6925600.1 biotin--[acetyl-CoA-carboxylase] ligase [Novosphingobium sp.]
MIQTVPETRSTNADLSARIAAGERLAEDDWLVADRQTAGRGRQGRAWFDGAGNFMGSTVVWPGRGDPSPGTLALVAGLAVQEVVAPLIPPPAMALLKWPNDLLVGSAKLCGILLERVGEAVIVGIGVNLAQAPQVEGRETLALSAFGPTPDRDLFASSLARQFSEELHRWRSFGLDPLLRRWQAAAHPPGTPLAVGEPGEEPLQGTFAGLASDGALQLRLADGTTRTIHAGEVRLG